MPLIIASLSSFFGSRRKEVLLEVASRYRLDDLDCGVCKDVVAAIDVFLLTNEGEKAVMEAGAKLCKSLEVEDDRVCDMLVREYKVGAFLRFSFNSCISLYAILS